YAMTIESYQNLFWDTLPKVEDQDLFEKMNERLREMYYHVGLKRIKALESLESLVTKDNIYKVHLVKDEYFPKGEEAVVADNGEYITLPCFKYETIVL
ncbi:MAG: hypothetical protein AAFP82_14600, partial [Bacteroidota bacterium]